MLEYLLYILGDTEGLEKFTFVAESTLTVVWEYFITYSHLIFIQFTAVTYNWFHRYPQLLDTSYQPSHHLTTHSTQNITQWHVAVFFGHFNHYMPRLCGQYSEGLFAHLFTPWRRVLLEKLTGSQLVKKFPAFYGTRRFITAITSASHLSLSWANSIQSIPHMLLPEDSS